MNILKIRHDSALYGSTNTNNCLNSSTIGFLRSVQVITHHLDTDGRCAFRS